MDDLVQRLRYAGSNRVVVGSTKRALCALAADEIERLRALASAQAARAVSAEFQCDALQAENFALAAGQCANVIGDEGGTPQCAEIKRLRAELAAEKDEVFRVQCEYSALHHKWAELLAERDALQADAGRFNFARAWLVKHGLLKALRCQPEAAMAVGYYWVLRKPAIIDGGSVEGYGKTEEAAIDAAMATPPESA